MCTTWTPTRHVTAHAIDREQVEEPLAVCGAALVVVSLNRPWSGEDTADTQACRRCIALVK
jgi:hypothetical protein